MAKSCLVEDARRVVTGRLEAVFASNALTTKFFYWKRGPSVRSKKCLSHTCLFPVQFDFLHEDILFQKRVMMFPGGEVPNALSMLVLVFTA
jgi:hypothetical protein